jgi:hypothetical protein
MTVPKEQKTAAELADMIAERLGIGGILVKVFKEPTYGWRATVITKPAAAVQAQAIADNIAQELGAHYDLKE